MQIQVGKKYRATYGANDTFEYEVIAFEPASENEGLDFQVIGCHVINADQRKIPGLMFWLDIEGNWSSIQYPGFIKTYEEITDDV